MEIPVFLTHHDPAGAKTYIALDRYDVTSTFFLPDVIATDFNVSRSRDQQHCSVRLDVEQDYCLLSVFAHQHDPILILGDCNVEMPVSTTMHQKSIVITEEHQFTTSTGRWQVEWDRSGTISNSMRPPPIPAHDVSIEKEYIEPLVLVPAADGYTLVEQRAMLDYSVERGRQSSISVTEIQLSPTTSHTSEDIDKEVNSSSIESFVPEVPGKRDTRPMGDLEESRLPVHAPSDMHGPGLGCELAYDEQQMPDGVGSTQPNPRPDSPSDLCDTGQAAVHNADMHESTESVVPSTTPVTQAPKVSVHNHKNLVLQKQHTHSSPIIRSGTSYSVDGEQYGDDESQQQKDTRPPKRDLYQIEHEASSQDKKKPRTSKQTFSNATIRATVPLTEDNATVAARSPVKRQRNIETQKQPDVDSSLTPSFTPTKRVLRKPGASTPSSSRSTKATDRKSRVVFSSTSKFHGDKNLVSAGKKVGITIVNDIHNADILCVGAGQLKRTSKLIIAVTKGMDVVTDDWIKEVLKVEDLPDCKPFLPMDRKHEEEWGFQLSEAVGRGKSHHNTKVLKGVHVYMTTQLRKDLGNLFRELKDVARVLGAEGVHAGLPKKTASGHILVVGSTKNIDPEGTRVGRLNHKLYSHDILTIGALRGQLEMASDEFVIQVPVKDEPNSSQ